MQRESKILRIRRYILVLLLMVVAGAVSGPSAGAVPPKSAKPLTITVRPFTTPEDAPALEVELSFRGSAAGKETLLLPSSWGGQEKLYSGIRDLEALSPDTEVKETDAPDRRSVKFPPGARVRLRYTVTQDWDGGFSEHVFRPALSAKAFTLIGSSFLVLPEWDQEMPRSIRLFWEIPEGWSEADSFGVQHKSVRSFSASLSQLQTAVYVGGDYRLHTFSVRNRSVTVALRGKWRFTDSQFCDLAQRIISAERSFWNDDNFPYFLITLTPTEEPGKDYQGTGLTNSFAAYADTGVELMAVPGLKHLLAHEIFHTWNPLRLSREGQFPDPQERHFWFGEGFSEYYAHQILLRAGLVSQQEYLDQLNSRIRAYDTSPVRGVSNDRVEKEFFTSDAVGKLPYQRGELLALRWNALIRNATGGRRSLDDVMRDLRRDAPRHARLRPEQAVAAAIRRYTKRDVSGEIVRYVIGGETIPLSPDALGPKVVLKQRKYRVRSL
jgi:predicted metalloprotease with PDZ domain